MHSLPPQNTPKTAINWIHTHYTLDTYWLHTGNRLKVYAIFTLKPILGKKFLQSPKTKIPATDLIARAYKLFFFITNFS